jgi:tRNA dimethylallyltransferase
MGRLWGSPPLDPHHRGGGGEDNPPNEGESKGGAPPLVVIVGPTAVGKTTLSLHLADALGGEIISADSRQVYRGMDIGTAKATAAERAQVPHHLIDVVDPDETLTLAEFQELAYAAIDAVLARGRVPLLVGGSGQYVRAVVEGWGIPRVPPQPELRGALERLEAGELGRWLSALDREAAERIDYRNRRRVIRALEVTLVTGRPISLQQRKRPPPYRILQVGLTLPRPRLYRRIDERVDRMLAGGLLEETRRLVAQYGWEVPALSGLGYAQLAAHLRGQMALDEALAAIKRETRRFVRQQANWFKKQDPKIHWFDNADPERTARAVEALVRDWLDTEYLE